MTFWCIGCCNDETALKTECSPLKQSMLKISANFIITFARTKQISFSQKLWNARCFHQILKAKGKQFPCAKHKTDHADFLDASFSSHNYCMVKYKKLHVCIRSNSKSQMLKHSKVGFSLLSATWITKRRINLANFVPLILLTLTQRRASQWP